MVLLIQRRPEIISLGITDQKTTDAALYRRPDCVRRRTQGRQLAGRRVPWLKGIMCKQVVNCVLLADRHHGLTEGVRGLLESAFDAVVMVADEASLLQSAERLQPTVAVVDLSLARGEGLQWLPRLRSRCPGLKLIVLSVHDQPSVCRAAVEAGADAFVLKRAIVTDLLSAIDAVQAGRSYVSPGVEDAPSRKD